MKTSTANVEAETLPEVKETFIWSDRYRPKTIDDCILPTKIKKTLNQIVTKKQIPNLLLIGKPGIGKSTAAHVLCEMLNIKPLWINGSKDAGIDVLRNSIERFASCKPLHGKYRVVVLDEADYLNTQSVQPALRGFIDTYQNNCRFILTGNYAEKILPPLVSRFNVVEFSVSEDEEQKMMVAAAKRCANILTNEKISFDVKALGALVKQHFPDFRKLLNELQRHAQTNGAIDLGSISNDKNHDYSELFKMMKGKMYGEVRKWVSSNRTDPNTSYTDIYDALWQELAPTSLPDAITTLAQYQYQSAFVANQELNLLACLTEIMFNSEWR